MESGHGSAGFLDKAKRWSWILWRLIVYALEYVADGIIEAWHVMRHDAGLFWGVGFTIIAIFGFSSGRYCDGNTAEYLSCTRPATYYFYDVWHVGLLVIGVFFILVWFLKVRHKH